MKNSTYSSIDPKTGSVTYQGPLELTKGDHSHMPARSEAYLPGDERGHVNASSLGGGNGTDNVVPQHADVNHGGYYSMEAGERAALKNGASIESTKTAIVHAGPSGRPEAFQVSDAVTYADGHTENIHLSFTNASYQDQATWNAQSAALPGAFDAGNPGDGLRGSMSSGEYTALMEQTDAQLPSIEAEYAPAEFSGSPAANAAGPGGTPETGDAADADADADTGAETDTSAGADPAAEEG